MPDVRKALKSKAKLRCAEIVIVMELLWMGSEIEGEIQNLNRKGREGHKGKMKGANDRALYFPSVLIRGSVRFWLKAHS